ncbi:MAG: methyltransferase domain-containing protein [Gammaproteobacteria bacterium]|nr:methyltransferase domain-containing protein [Gammaproteobacteria bacterium]
MKRRKKNYRHGCGSDPLTIEGLRDWYRSDLGQRLLKQEKSTLEPLLASLFGYHLLQVGVMTEDDLLRSSLIPNCMILDSNIKNGIDSLNLSAITKAKIIGGLPDALPIASDSLDVMLLPHVLEFSRDPHQVLREVDRALIPEGHVVISGFSPWSSWLIWRLLLGWRKQPPWCGRFISLARVKDWLRLLGFEIMSVQHVFYRPPIQHDGIMNRLSFVESFGKKFLPIYGASYTLVAKKRVFTVTPIKPRWKPRRFVPSNVVEPQNRRKLSEEP